VHIVNSLFYVIIIGVVLLVAGKAQQLIQGLTASGDEGQQLSAVIELCQV